MIEACSLKSSGNVVKFAGCCRKSVLFKSNLCNREASRYGMVMFHTEITYGQNPEPATKAGLGNPYNNVAISSKELYVGLCVLHLL